MIAPLPPSVRSTDRRLRFLASAYRLLLDDLWRMVNHAPTPLVSEVDGEYARGPHEERLDPLPTLADLYTTVVAVMLLPTGSTRRSDGASVR